VEPIDANAGSAAVDNNRSFPFPFFNGFGFTEKREIILRLPSGRSLGEAKVGNLKMGPLHTHLEKGAVNLVRRGKLGGILNDNSLFVKKIVFVYLTGYRSNSIELANRGQATITK